MNKKTGIILSLFILFVKVHAQELFVQTEPASNMASKSLGWRLNQDFKFGTDKMAYRINPEIMVGLNQNWMIHLNAYWSNIYQKDMIFEGLGIYGKYRILNTDEAQSHLRLSVYGRVSSTRNTSPFQEINLQGDNSGWLGGFVITQLLHKIAFSSSLDFDHAFQTGNNQISYTLSGGYLVLPIHYTSYKQTNLNLYLEFLGKSSLDHLGYYLDIAPSIQFIFNSKTRLDLGFSSPLAGHLSRFSNQSLLIRLEHNLFNAF
jgi:hypothetical protein